MSKSDGISADYYELPKGATQLQDLISYRNLNAQDGEMFRAIYRKGRASHSDSLRDARKVLFYATAEVKRLEALYAHPDRAYLGDFGQQNMIETIDCDSRTITEWPADDSRIDAIGRNGNDGFHYQAVDVA